MKTFFFNLLVLFFVFPSPTMVFSQSAKTAVEKITDVSFCDLLENRNDYSGKFIRVTAIYWFGFETTGLHCPNCAGGAPIWVECSDTSSDCIPKKFKAKFREERHGVGKTLKVTLIGKFNFGGSFGHLGAYQNAFFIETVEKAEVISKSGLPFESLPEKDKAKADCVAESKKD